MPETAPPLQPWPRPLAAAVLLAYVLFDGVLWIAGFFLLFREDYHNMVLAGQLLTAALVVMLLGGWAWRWAVARGWIGGRPTPRFA